MASYCWAFCITWHHHRFREYDRPVRIERSWAWHVLLLLDALAWLSAWVRVKRRTIVKVAQATNHNTDLS